MPTSPSSGSITSPVPERMNVASASATASSASRRRSTRSMRHSLASSTAARGRLPRNSSSFASKRANSVKASAAAPAKPASTRSWYTFRTLRAPAFMMVCPTDTCPSPATATRPRCRTETTVVAWIGPERGDVIALGWILSGRPGMGRIVHPHQVLRAHVRVALRGGEPAVAEQLLDQAEVGSLAQHVGGEAVAQGVRGHALAEPRPAGHALDDPVGAPGGEPAAPGVLEQGAAPATAQGQMGGQGLERGLADRHDALLGALADHAHGAPGLVEVVEVEAAGLGDPEAAGVEELHQRPVPRPRRARRRGRVEQVRGLVLGQERGQAAAEARAADLTGRV